MSEHVADALARPRFPVLRAEHKMEVQREMRRSHAGSFQIGRRMAIANSAPVPEAREKLAGGETTGQRRRNTNRALKGREKATRGLAGNIAEEHSNASRAPAGAHPVSGVLGRPEAGDSRSLRRCFARLTTG